MNADQGERSVQVDVAVIGAGPAGSLAASLLTRRGFQVLVLERERFPRFVIGESLLPVCMDLMEEAGQLDAIQACGFQKKNGAIFMRGDAQDVFDFGEGYTEGYGATFQVVRSEFDDALARRAAEQGVTFWFEHSVDDVTFPDPDANGDGNTVRLDVSSADRPATVHARFVLDASGPGQVLARRMDLVVPSDFEPRIALFTHFEDAAELCTPDPHKLIAAIHPTQDGVWYWGIPFSSGRGSVGVVAPASLMEGSEEDPEGFLRRWVAEEPFLGPNLTDGRIAFPVRRIVGYASSVRRLYGHRFALLGNSGEFLDPIFSSGVALAFKGASLAAAATAEQLEHEAGQREQAPDWDAQFEIPMRNGLRTFGEFVRAWYDGRLQTILFHPAKNESIKRMVCSVLAGYAWDDSNPFVAETEAKLRMLHSICSRARPA